MPAVPSPTRTLYVHVPRLNVRSAPEVTPDNIVDVLSLGDPVEVLTERAEKTPDGWVWRRLAESDTHWLAEVNDETGLRLLDEEPPEAEADAAPQELFVTVDGVRLRRSPRLLGDNAFGFFAKGHAVRVAAAVRRIGPRGWVWRQVVSEEGGWVAEYHCRSGERLMAFSPPEAEAPDSDLPTARGRASARGRVQTRGMGFLLDGQPLRFMGVNLREFPFYGRGDVLPHANLGHQDEQIRAVEQIGMRVVRMHACHRRVRAGEAIPLVRQALDKLHEAGLLAIVVLNDALGQYYVHGDDPFHRHQLGHLDKTDYFVREGYRQNYLPFVEAIVPALADHPAIFAWELGNEYAIIPQPASAEESEAFFRFAQTVSGRIRALAPDHLITTGLVNTGHVAPSGGDRIAYAKRLYGLPTLDFATVHFYQDNPEEQNGLPDMDVMKALNKPLIVEEYGAFEGDKAAVVDGRIRFWLEIGAVGFMQWGLSATANDIGVGDNKHGMDPYAERNRGHFDKLKAVYRKWAQSL